MPEQIDEKLITDTELIKYQQLVGSCKWEVPEQIDDNW